MTKLLPNLPIENLTLENDYIGIITKGELIKAFFLANKTQFSQIKIFSIYGEWRMENGEWRMGKWEEYFDEIPSKGIERFF